ncbi:MAG: histidinol-phosphatase HisJ family protein [Peptococcaceae bacterium]|nr:histidinol-phosphatase HisJ family protein [Candidatus Syntrophopropionicum ammoniitolerans]
MIPVDNHLHTRLCGHATGEAGAYISQAAKLGIREVGFCDHLPLYFLPQDKMIPDYAMNEDELPGYVRMIKKLADQAPLQVKLGIEADFVSGQEERLADMLAPHKFDFITGSVHFIDGWGFDNPAERAEYARRDIDTIYKRYFALVQQAAQTGLFDIMAHPDLIKKFNYRPHQDPWPLYEETARVFKNAGVCVEVNSAGLRYPVQEIYPGPELLQIFFAHGLPVTLGSDAHRPADVGAGLPQALELIKSVGYREVATFSNRRIKFVSI